MNTVEILRAARERIDTPEKWTQGRYEQDGAYCASGALRRVAGSQAIGGRAYAALSEAMGIDGLGVCCWNDEHSHAEVLAAFDRAIAAEEARA